MDVYFEDHMGKAKNYGQNIKCFVHKPNGTHTYVWGLKSQTFFCNVEASSPLFAYQRFKTDNLPRRQVTEGLQCTQLSDDNKLCGFVLSNYNRDC